MKNKFAFVLSPIMLAMGLGSGQAIAQSQTETADEQQIEKLIIVGNRDQRVSEGATGLTLEINETPQSISVLSEQQMKNYAAFSINDALKLANGISVEEWETNRTNYVSRGFEVKNTQIDGIGLPNNWGIVTGAIDAYGYEKIEVIRGANGLLTGVGNSSGTINYVRKRPTNEDKGEVGFAIGSFDYNRLQADYSMSLTESGSWAARVVASNESKGSHLKGLENDRSYLYAVVDGQLNDFSTLTLGYSYQDADTQGNTWGGLVYNYTDGTQAEWNVEDTTSQDWTMWDTINTNAFVEFTYLLPNDWTVKATYNNRTFEEESKLFYAYGSIDKNTGLGLTGWPGRYDSEREADLFEVSASGYFNLFGNEHELSLGASTASSNDVSIQHPFDFATTPAYGPTPAFPYSFDAVEEPVWLSPITYSDMEQTLSRVYGSAKITLSDTLFAIAGFNSISYERKGVNNGAEIVNEESELSPYFGVTYKFNDTTNFYASYSDIYQPQEQYDIEGQFLAPTKGVNFEAGVKSQFFDDKLLITFAVFTAEQQDIAAFAGIIPETLQYYYKGVDVKSEGYELEAVGKINEQLTVNFAYTSLNVTDEAGEDTQLWAPRDAINFSVDYKLPTFDQLTLGLGGKWQSEVSNVDYNVTQGSYALLNAFAKWQINEQLNVLATVQNLTDEKYINSLHTVGYYGAPTNGSLSVNYSF